MTILENIYSTFRTFIYGHADEIDFREGLTLEEKIEYNRKKLKFYRNKKVVARNILIALIFILSSAFVLIFIFSDNEIIGFAGGMILVYAVIFLILSISSYSSSSNSAYSMELELKDLENELDLASIDFDSIERRAEKLFKVNQDKLDKYYTQNLQQGNRIFKTGLFFFVVGFIIVCISMYFISRPIDQNKSIIIAGLGAIGTILSNFMAAIYIKMFSETAKTSTQFHNRLVNTHSLMFSNLISSKISEKLLRENTYSKIASSLAKLSFPSEKGYEADEVNSKENIDDSKKRK